MNFYKTYWGGEKGVFGVSIRTNLYSRTLEFIQKLVKELAKDYPEEEVTPDKLRIVIYDGDRFAGQMGVEFNTCTPSKNYTKIHQPECLK